MVIGILQFELLIHDAQSLKDKRRVVSSVKDRLHREHQVSVAEVGAQENPGLARMALALVTGDGKRAAAVLDQITTKLRALRDAELGDVSREVLHEADAARRETLDEPPDVAEELFRRMKGAENQ